MKMSYRILSASFLTAILFVCSSAFAQQTGLSGVVTDVQGGLIQGAKVVAKETDGSSFDATTNAQGVYVIPGIAAAEYTITVTAPGFNTVQRKILLLVGQLAQVDIS